MGRRDFVSGDYLPVHKPVLLAECLNYLSLAGETYAHGALMIDCTLGEGGHSEAFLTKHTDLRIIGLDADPEIQARAKARLAVFGGRVTFHTGWFNDFLANYFSGNYPPPNLILFDLGVSVYHYELSGRGFSFSADENLDMRLNPLSEATAAGLVNRLSETELADVIFHLADERYSRRIARAIMERRKSAAIWTATELAEIVYRAVPAAYRHGGIHPATKTFQALRIVVNDELARLFPALQSAFEILSPGGKLGVISFHSLEDRVVKNYFRSLCRDCICPPEEPICKCGGKRVAEGLTKKSITAGEAEVCANPPSRSARLRVVRKLEDENAARKRFASIK
jgi:16S rRNA (cytosine1402-N4)-methyltransferase